MTAKLDQFTQELDILLGLQPGQPAESPVLQTASTLIGIDFDTEIRPRPELRSQWISRILETPRQRPSRKLAAARWAWATAMILVIALLIAFHQPVFAAVGRLFGYIYFQDTGFLPADSTMVLAQPVVQTHNQRSLEVLRGISTPGETTLYLEYSDTASPADGALLETPTGETISLSWWEYSPNGHDSHGLRLTFPALPEEMTQTTLVLPEGWRLPLSWIPALGSGLPDVQVIPYPETDAETSISRNVCDEKNGIEFCVLAATTSTENTSILVQAQSSNGGLNPENSIQAGTMWQGLVWQTETEKATLHDSQGNSYPMDSEWAGTLTFPPMPGSQQVTLNVPALLAGVDVPEQTIVLDVGSDPQPDTVIPLDISIQVLDMTVHFSQATFVGDGVNSLRLVLDADPVQTVNGLTPAALEISKPDRVDDMYGMGMLAGSKDIFIELVRPQGKVTGTITIPVIGATVIVDGPFEISFALTEAEPITSTPIVVDPNTFSPAPTLTPLSLDSYAYSGQAIQRGDLLYTSINGDNTDVYVFMPHIDVQPRLLATLPGAISHVYVHPDREGLDYLAGSHEFRDGFSYIDNIRLYTLRFGDGKPRLLYNFAPNPTNSIGTTVYADWSFDGKYMAFRDTGGGRPGIVERFGWFDMSCRTSGLCPEHEILVNEHLSLSPPIFSPYDYRILFSGADGSGTGEPDEFLLDFDPEKPDTQIVNLTTQIFVSDGINIPTWTSDGKILNICFDGMSWETNVFCFLDPLSGDITYGEPISPNLGDYRLYGGMFWLQPFGNQVATKIFPKNGTNRSLQELRLMDLNGQLGPKLAESYMIEQVNFSPTGEWLTYVTEDETHLFIADTNTGISVLVQERSEFRISWVGWVR